MRVPGTRISLFLAAATVAGALGGVPVVQGGEETARGDSYVQGLARRESARFERTWTDAFVEVLSVRSGMTILDIGTGTGQYALAFAELLKGTGRVFATDIKPELIAYASGEARRRGLKNLSFVLVSKDGLDEFYGGHKYDVVSLFHVSVIHASKVDYFRALKEFLDDEGLLVITYEARFPPFSVSDVTDFTGLVEDLSSLPADSPFHGGLRESTREMAGMVPAGEEPDDLLKEAIVEDFNRILSDVVFGGAFAEGMSVSEGAALTPVEREYADWLVLQLKSKGVFAGSDLRFDDTKNAATLNRLLLVQRFRRRLAEGVVSPFGHGRKAAGIIEKLEKAGFRLKAIHDDVVPFEITLVFSAP